MLTDRHNEIVGKIWEIANRLRGPYRPPQYRLVMLPIVVLRRLDCVLEPTKDAVLAEHARLVAARTAESAIPRLLTRVVGQGRQQPLYNTSPYTFQKLLGDSENIAPNLVAYINGFSGTARRIFEKFKFSDQIEKLDSSNRLYATVQAMAGIDLHPERISNIEMGYVFEHLVMRFNEQANEEAGDHFTPREVIRLMTHLVYTGEEDVYKPGVYREIYDPACGTGGMLSVSEETIRAGNASANLGLYGQEYNDESWAICCSDKLLQPAIFTPQDVTDFAAVWFKPRRDPSGQDHKQMNGILDRCVARFAEREETEQEEFRGLLTAFRNLYGFLSLILPYFDQELEQLYAFIRNLGSKLPHPGDGARFTLDDDVALKFFRLREVNEGAIDLSQGEADPLKGPTDVGTAREKDTEVALSTLVGQLNERFGTDFTEADQLFFDQVRATAELDEKVVEAARANTEANFSAFFGRILDDLFIQRMEGNDEIFNRVMNDKQFRTAAQDHLAREVYERIRGDR